MLNADRTIRFLVAFVLAILCFTHLVSPGIGMILLIVSVVFWVTSYTGFCPFYWLFGFKGHTHHVK